MTFFKFNCIRTFNAHDETMRDYCLERKSNHSKRNGSPK